MCTSCQLTDEMQATPSARRRWASLGAGLLIVAAGAASAALGIASLLAHHATRPSMTAGLGRVLELRGRDLQSGRPLAAALSHRPLLVEFWSAACPACRQAATSLQRLATGNHAVVLVGIDVGDTPATARALLRGLGWRQLSAADPAGHYAQTLQLRALPTTILLDSNHRIVSRAVGLDSLATLEPRR